MECSNIISAPDRFASGWKEPLCLIESTKDDQLEVNQETLSMLQKITDPVVVVGIVGLYRTGKSYLMNRLAGQPHGFELGSTIQSKTKGIWVWCVPHPTRKNTFLVLLDTEGLGDVEKGNMNHDIWIFSLAVLLSSTLVYNSIGTISQQALNDLHFVTEMAEHVKIKSSGNDDDATDFDKFFPSFVWAVRDFSLGLEIDGKTITEDEYLDHALQLKPVVGRKSAEYNLPRECIRTYFSRRKCFLFPRPVDDQNMLKIMETIADSKLNPEFLQQIKAFLQYVFESSRTKAVNGKAISGRLLGGLVSCYVEAIRDGAVPCIESAVETTAKVENERAIKEALELYGQRFRESVRFPTETMIELSNCHHVCERDAAEYFMKVAIFDSEKLYYQRMMGEVAAAYQAFVDENETASRRKCESLLSTMHQAIGNDFKAGKYARPGGYESYRTDMDSLVQKYRQTPGKGVLSEEVLCEFMKQQEVTSASALKADEQLTEETRKAEEERQKAKASERQKLAAEEELRKNEQLMADEKRSFEDHIQRLERQAEEDRKGFEQRASANKSIGEQNLNGSGIYDLLGNVIRIIPPILELWLRSRR